MEMRDYGIYTVIYWEYSILAGLGDLILGRRDYATDPRSHLMCPRHMEMRDYALFVGSLKSDHKCRAENSCTMYVLV